MKNLERNLIQSEHLATFLAVADCANITHAAETMGRTQSAVSVQIKKLEDVLGVSLFERQSRGMILSREGRMLLPVARKVTLEMQQLPKMFGVPLKGRIRVGIPDCYPESIFETVLAEFSKMHKQVEVSARFGCTSNFSKLIDYGKLDVAIVSGACPNPVKMLKPDRNVWAAGLDFEAEPDSVLPLAIIDRDCGWRNLGTEALDHAGRKWRIAYSSENFAGVKSAIRSGLAIGVLPDILLDYDMKVLPTDCGLPLLPDTQRGIIINASAPTELVDAMVEAIRSAV